MAILTKPLSQLDEGWRVGHINADRAGCLGTFIRNQLGVPHFSRGPA